MNKTLITAAAAALTAAALTRCHFRRTTLNALYWQDHYHQIDQLGALHDLTDAIHDLTDALADQTTVTAAGLHDQAAVTAEIAADLLAIRNHIQQWDPPK